MTTSLVFADDHEIVRYGMSLLLNAEPDIEVVGEAGNAAETLAVLAQAQPDVLLLDLFIPGANGLSLVQQVRERHPDVKIVMLSGQADTSAVRGCLQAGVKGFVRKDDEAQELIKAVRAVIAGERYLSPYLAQVALEAYSANTSEQRRLAALTEREREVIRLAATGLTSAEIAAQLYISHRTVETHRARAMQKLGLRNEVELGRFFLNLDDPAS